jgi:hypothetical protein
LLMEFISFIKALVLSRVVASNDRLRLLDK